MQIRDLHNPWRDKYQQAMFRSAMFFVETDTRASGRRVALHQYPKRNVPYAEDMGRTAIAFQVQGYLIGPVYLDLKNNLIDALEKDGPGMLRLPLPYKGSDIQVMVQSYSISESRDKGGFCTVEMTFVEYGDPVYRSTVANAAQIAQSAAAVESAVIGPPTPATLAQTKPFADVHSSANLPQGGPEMVKP
jgi:prophage DNA circulation protein